MHLSILIRFMDNARISTVEEQTSLPIIRSCPELVDQIVLTFPALVVMPIVRFRAYVPVPWITLDSAALRRIGLVITEEGIKPLPLAQQNVL